MKPCLDGSRDGERRSWLRQEALRLEATPTGAVFTEEAVTLPWRPPESISLRIQTVDARLAGHHHPGSQLRWDARRALAAENKRRLTLTNEDLRRCCLSWLSGFDYTSQRSPGHTATRVVLCFTPASSEGPTSWPLQDDGRGGDEGSADSSICSQTSCRSDLKSKLIKKKINSRLTCGKENSNSSSDMTTSFSFLSFRRHWELVCL